MLRVDLRALADGSVEVDAEVPASDSRFDGLEFELNGPVCVKGRLSRAGEGDYFLHGSIEATVKAECRRCLEPMVAPARSELSALFTLDDETGDPSVYVIPERATDLDLGDLVREELILAIPSFPVCTEGCKGLCVRCGANLNMGDCACEAEGDSRWATLQQLRNTLTDERGNDGGTEEKNIT